MQHFVEYLTIILIPVFPYQLPTKFFFQSQTLTYLTPLASCSEHMTSFWLKRFSGNLLRSSEELFLIEKSAGTGVGGMTSLNALIAP